MTAIQLPRIGQYDMIRCQVVVNHFGEGFKIAIYGALNIGGLIGPEFNGIVIFSEKYKSVILDEHCKANSGYFGPSVNQEREFDRIINMNDDDFQNFVNSHRRSRMNVPYKKPREPRLNIKRFIDLVNNKTIAYNPELKDEFHRDAKKILRLIAKGLGLKVMKGKCEIRSNMGGIAGSGEVTLRSDRIFIEFSQYHPVSSDETSFYFRRCDGIKDYSGRDNQWMPFSKLTDMRFVIDRIRETMDKP